MQDKRITISRASGSLTFPADFLMVGAMNPCQCGLLFTDPAKCSCKKRLALDQLRKIMGPFADRIAIEIETRNEFMTTRPGIGMHKSSAQILNSILEARNRMKKRNHGLLNGALPADRVLAIFQKIRKHDIIAKHYAGKLQLTYRGLVESIKVAITVQDMQSAPHLTEEHLYEALAFRILQSQVNRIRQVA